MKNFGNEPRRQEPGNLFSNSFSSFFVESPKKLPDRLILRINIESVLSEFSRHTRHVRRFPCKDVPVLTDELDECTFIFRIQIGTNTKLLRRIAQSKVNKLGFSSRLKLHRRVMLCGWLL